MTDKQAAALARLTKAAPHIKIAAEMARLMEPTGKIQLGIISKRQDGSGHVGATFDAEEFIADLCILADLPGRKEDSHG